MGRFCWIALFSALISAAIHERRSAAAARETVLEHWCRGGRQARSLSAAFVRRVPFLPAGVPLDEALERRERDLRSLRQEARRYFVSGSDESPAQRGFSALKESHTLVLSEEVRERLGIGAFLGGRDIANALRYRELYWRQYVERFTSIKEAPSDEGGALKFEVSLDLSLFCRYGRPIRELVSRSAY